MSKQKPNRTVTFVAVQPASQHCGALTFGGGLIFLAAGLGAERHGVRGRVRGRSSSTGRSYSNTNGKR